MNICFCLPPNDPYNYAMMFAFILGSFAGLFLIFVSYYAGRLLQNMKKTKVPRAKFRRK
jgi:hypothetical protein